MRVRLRGEGEGEGHLAHGALEARGDEGGRDPRAAQAAEAEHVAQQQQQQRVGRVERRRRGGGALVAHAGVGADDEGVAEGDGLHLGVGGRRSG